MPAKSGKHYRFMQMIAHGGSSDGGMKNIGPSKDVAKEFVSKTPKKKRSLFMKDK